MSNIVSDVSGNRNDKIANAAKVLGRSMARKEVFLAIYNGKKRIKSVQDIIKLSGIKSNIRILQEAKKLVNEDLVRQIKLTTGTVYEKIDFYTHHRTKILQLANNKVKLNEFPTKINPQTQNQVVKISIPKKMVNHQQITVDDIDSFSKVKKIALGSSISKPLAESKIKSGFQKVIGDKGKFTDWGGEINDLYTSRVIVKGKRKSTAIAFKGKATKGILTPKKLGKNGDQIQRLFRSTAEIFIIQYQGPIDQSVLEQMQSFAISKSYTEGNKIYYGIIDGQDTARLLQAYSKQFK